MKVICPPEFCVKFPTTVTVEFPVIMRLPLLLKFPSTNVVVFPLTIISTVFV